MLNKIKNPLHLQSFTSSHYKVPSEVVGELFPLQTASVLESNSKSQIRQITSEFISLQHKDFWNTCLTYFNHCRETQHWLVSGTARALKERLFCVYFLTKQFCLLFALLFLNTKHHHYRVPKAELIKIVMKYCTRPIKHFMPAFSPSIFLQILSSGTCFC